MNKPLTLRMNFVWALVGNAVAAFCSWILLMILVKLSTAEVVGVFAVAQAVCLPISALLGLQLTIVLTTDAQNDYHFGHYYALRIITSGLAIGLGILVGSLFYSGEVFHIIILLSISYAILAVRDVFLAFLRKSERMDKVAVSRTLLGLLSAVLFGILFWVSNSLILSVLGLIAARFMVVYFHDIPVTRILLSSSAIDSKPLSTKLLWSKKVLWRLAKTAMPLGLVGLFQTLYASIPRLVIDKYFGKGEVGYFAALSSLLMIGMIIIAALGHAVTPRLAKYYFENLGAYKRLLGKLMGIGAAIGISGIVVSSLFGKLILTLLFRADYAEHNDVFIWITIAGAILFIFSFMNAGLSAARKFKIQVPIYGLATTVCAGFSLWLIPYYGMIGAVWAIIACYGFGLLGCTVFVVRAIKERAWQKAVKDIPDATR